MILKNSETQIPDQFTCPILREIMHDPVLAMDGHSYERRAITRWLERNSASPKTNAKLPSKRLVENVALKQSIEAFIEEENAKYDAYVKSLEAQAQSMSQQQQASSDLVASLQEQLVLGKKENAQKIKKSSEAVKAKHQSKIESMQAEIDRLREASSMPRTAVIINANINSDALQALANKHYFAKDYQQAADCFQKLIDMGVNSISVYKHYGNALNKLRRPSEAAQVFDKALAIDSNDPFSLKGKGFALMHAGDKQSALAIFSSVLANDPSDQLAIDQVQRLSQTARPQLGYASNSSGRSSLFFAPASSGHPRPRNRHHASQGDSIRPSQLYAKR